MLCFPPLYPARSLIVCPAGGMGTSLTIRLGFCLTEKKYIAFIFYWTRCALSLPLLLLASNQYSIDANTIIILLWPFICQNAQQERILEFTHLSTLLCAFKFCPHSQHGRFPHYIPAETKREQKQKQKQQIQLCEQISN